MCSEVCGKELFELGFLFFMGEVCVFFVVGLFWVLVEGELVFRLFWFMIRDEYCFGMEFIGDSKLEIVDGG